MARRSQINGLLGSVLILGTVLVAGCHSGSKACVACQREECKGMAFKITLASGKTVATCCPRCGAHYLATQTAPPRSMQATDIMTGQAVDAQKAVYVVGSDVSPCATMDVKRDAYGCCMYKDFDRCQPSTLAFADKKSAQEFIVKHGGKIMAWDELLTH